MEDFQERELSRQSKIPFFPPKQNPNNKLHSNSSLCLFPRCPASILFDLGNTMRNRQASFQHEDRDVSKGEVMNLRPCHTSSLQNPDRAQMVWCLVQYSWQPEYSISGFLPELNPGLTLSELSSCKRNEKRASRSTPHNYWAPRMLYMVKFGYNKLDVVPILFSLGDN